MPSETVLLELPLNVLCRLLQERSLSACELRYLDQASHQAGCWAVKASCSSVLPCTECEASGMSDDGRLY